MATGAVEVGRFPDPVVPPPELAEASEGGMAGNQRVSGIVTPEAVVLHFETAGVASRALARLMDLFVQLTLLSVLVFAVGLLAGVVRLRGPEVLVVAMLVAVLLVVFGYPIALEALWNGRTVGKAALGLRVVTREGAPVRLRHTAVRGLIGVVEVYALPFVAILTTGLSPTNQRVGDFAAGTIVVRQRSARRTAVALAFPPPPGLEGFARSLDVSRVTPAQYRVLRSFLTRVGELQPGPRMALGNRLAAGMVAVVGQAPPPQVPPELFLVCTAAAYQWRHGGLGAVAAPLPPPPWGAPAWGAPPPAWGAPPPAWGAPPPARGPGGWPAGSGGWGAPPPTAVAPSPGASPPRPGRFPAGPAGPGGGYPPGR